MVNGLGFMVKADYGFEGEGEGVRVRVWGWGWGWRVRVRDTSAATAPSLRWQLISKSEKRAQILCKTQWKTKTRQGVSQDRQVTLPKYHHWLVLSCPVLSCLVVSCQDSFLQSSIHNCAKIWELDTTRQDKARQGKTRQDKTRQGKARQGTTRQVNHKTRQD